MGRKHGHLRDIIIGIFVCSLIVPPGIHHAGAEGIDPLNFVDLFDTEGADGYVSGISWNPSGSMFIGSWHGGYIRVHSTSNGTVLWQTKYEVGAMLDVAWSPDGTKCISHGGGTQIHVWDAQNWTRTAVLYGHEYVITSLSWCPDSTRFVSSSSDSVIMWNVQTGEKEKVITMSAADVSWSPDGKMIACGGYQMDVIVLDATTGNEVKRFPNYYIEEVSWSPDSTMLVSAGHGVQVWDVESGKMITNLYSSYMHYVDWSRDGRYIATGFNDGLFMVWSTTDWSALVNLTTQKGSFMSLAWNPNSTILATGSGFITLWGAGAPDIRIEGFTADKDRMVIGDNVTFNVTIANNGTQPVFGQKIELYEGGNLFGQVWMDIPRHSNNTTSFIWYTIDATALGEHHFRLWAGGAQQLLTIEVLGKPRPVIAEILADRRTVFPGDEVNLAVVVANTGNGDAFGLQVYLSDGTGIISTAQTDVRAGERSSVSFIWNTTDSTPTGVHGLTVTVGDHMMTCNVTVVGPSTVYVRDVKSDKSSIVLGESVVLSGTVVNRGGLNLFGLVIRIYDGQELFACGTVDIGANGLNTTSWTWSTNESTAPGNHTFILRTGPSSKEASITVVEIPAVVITKVSLSKTSVGPGGKFTIDAEVANKGKRNCTIDVIFYFGDLKYNSLQVSIPKGESKNVSCPCKVPADVPAGNHDIRVEAGPSNRSTTITVTPPPTPSKFIPASGVPLALAAMSLAVLVHIRKRAKAPIDENALSS